MYMYRSILKKGTGNQVCKVFIHLFNGGRRNTLCMVEEMVWHQIDVNPFLRPMINFMD